MGKVVTLGEIMLRLSTQQGMRLTQSETLTAQYGGSEANVAISLANYGHQVIFASKVPENSLGDSVRKQLNRYQVDTRFLLNGGSRLGIYYVEAGIGQRADTVIYDRGFSSFAEMTELEWDLQKLFCDVDLFHISGITPALSPVWNELILMLIKAAKQQACKISFDINYRSKLWPQAEAAVVLQKILPYVDYCSAGKADALHLMKIKEFTGAVEEELAYYYQEMQALYPNIEIFYSTNRQVVSASENTLVGTIWINQTCFQSNVHLMKPIVDRVGGGDAFCGGILHGLLTKKAPQHCVEFATAAAALKHTVFGDCNQFSEAEVKQFMVADSGKIVR